MSLVINTNVSSLNAQNNLTKSRSALAQATERLSSGLKINSAADNAAGFAISQRYTTQIGGLAQASANASDAINLAQTAGSALNQVTSNLQAIRDLAAQSANGTYSDSDRATIDQEVQQRLAEVTRIANQTTFNGKKVLDGSLSTQSFQIGADVGQTVSVSLGTGVKASQLGNIATTSSGDISAKFATPAGLTLAAGDLKVGNTNVAAGNYTSAAGLAAAINTAAGSTIATVSGNELALDNSTASAITFSGAKAASLGLGTVAAKGASTTTNGTGTSSGLTADISSGKNAITLAAGDFTVGGTNVTGTFKNIGELVTAVNAAGVAGITAADDGTGHLKLTNSSGAGVVVAGGAATSLGINGTVAAAGNSTSTSTVAADVTANANAIELGAGQLNINGTDVTGVFKDAASLKALVDGAGISGLTTTVNAGELSFTNSSASAVTFGGTLALGLPASVAAATTTPGADGTATSTGVNTAVTAAATSGLTLAAGDLTIDGKQITGKFASVQDLSDQINAEGVGANAAVNKDGTGFNLYSATDITVSTGAGLGANSLANASAAATANGGNSLQGGDVKNVDDANALISRIDVALSSVSNFAAQLGAVQNRFQSTISTLSSQSTNLQSAQSTIQDADFAAETANLSKAGVLQQAGISVLAQANSNPQQVLKLLQ
jgi:flagellin